MAEHRHRRRAWGRGWRSVAGAALLGGVLAPGAWAALAATATAPAGASTHGMPGKPAPHRLEPLAADAYLQAQRAGAGSSTRTAQRFAAAEQQAKALPLAPSAGGGESAHANALLPTRWTSIGPRPVGTSFYGQDNTGRVTGLAVSTVGGTDHLVLGSAGGGVWTASAAGSSTIWSPTTDTQKDLAIGAVAVDPSTPTVLFAGTGEGNHCGDCYPGLGILESTDGGATWTLSNPSTAFTGLDVSSIVVEPGATRSHLTVMVATTLPGYTPTTTKPGLFVSTDSGSTWGKVTGGGWVNGSVTGLTVDAAATGGPAVFATVAQVGVERSTDNGATWSTVSGTTAPAGPTVVVAPLAVTQTATLGSAVVYASVGAVTPGATQTVYGGLFKSTDGGTTWSKVASTPPVTSPAWAYTGTKTDTGGDQSTYDNAVAIAPTTPTGKKVAVAGINAVASADGGSTWYDLNGKPFFQPRQTTVPLTTPPNFLHPDFHALTFDPTGNLYLGNDGGVWQVTKTVFATLGHYFPQVPAGATSTPATVTATRSARGSAAYANLNNASLVITQFYEGTAQVTNAATVLAGAQDNGTVLFSGSAVGRDVLAGDGGYSAINPLATQEQLGEADKTLNETGTGWATYATVTPPGGATGANFVPPMILLPDPGAKSTPTVYYGGLSLWRTTDPSHLTATSGRPAPTWKAVATGLSAPVSALAVAPSDPTVLYFGLDDGTIEYTTDASAPAPAFHVVSGTGLGRWVTDLFVDPATAGHLLVTTSTSMVQATTPVPPQVVSITAADTVAPTTTAETGDLPASDSSNAVVFDPARDTYDVATDVGVFSTAALAGTATKWSRVGTTLPNVQVIGLSATADGTLLAATHGRGLWKVTTSAAAPTAPTPPTTLTATAGNGQVNLTWKAPVNDGGSPLTGYQVFESTTPGGERYAVPAATVGASTDHATVTGLADGTTYYFTVRAQNIAGESSPSNETSATPTAPPTTAKPGYWEVASDGGLFAFTAPFHGSMGGKPLNAPIVGMAKDPATGGYWEVASDGGIFAFTAPFYGSMGGKPLNEPIVAMAATPTGKGYWEVASDGGIFAFGNAAFHGSMGGKPLNEPIVSMAVDAATGGYWEVASDGGLFAFTAPFHGSMGGKPLNRPIVGMAATAKTGGYWEVASDGGLFAFTVPFHGSMGGKPLNEPIVAMAATPSSSGYWEVASDGGIFAFTAPFKGSMGGKPLNEPIVGMAAAG